MRYGLGVRLIWRRALHINSKRIPHGHCEDIFLAARTKRKSFYSYNGRHISSQTTSKLSCSNSAEDQDQGSSCESSSNESLLQDRSERNGQQGGAVPDDSQTSIESLASTSSASERPVLESYVIQNLHDSAYKLSHKQQIPKTQYKILANLDLSIDQATSDLYCCHITEVPTGHVPSSVGDTTRNGYSGSQSNATQLPSQFEAYNESTKRPASGDNNDSYPEKRSKNDPPAENPEYPESSDNKKFACPFAYHNPERYRKCERHKFKNVAEVKQHLVRNHMMGDHYCKTCHRYCDPKKNPDIDDHSKCDLSTEIPVKAYERHLRFKDCARKRGSEDEKWHLLYRALFPEDTKPESSQTKDTLSEDLEEFLEFLGNDPEIKTKLGLDFIKTRLDSSISEGRTSRSHNVIIKRITEILTPSSQGDGFLQSTPGVFSNSGYASEATPQPIETLSKAKKGTPHGVRTTKPSAQSGNDRTTKQPNRKLRHKPGSVATAKSGSRSGDAANFDQTLPEPQHILPSNATQTDITNLSWGPRVLNIQNQTTGARPTGARMETARFFDDTAQYQGRTSTVYQLNVTRPEIPAFTNTVAMQDYTSMPNNFSVVESSQNMLSGYRDFQNDDYMAGEYSDLYAGNADQHGVHPARIADTVDDTATFETQLRRVARDSTRLGANAQVSFDNRLPVQQAVSNGGVFIHRGQNYQNHQHHQDQQYHQNQQYQQYYQNQQYQQQ